MVFIQLLTGLRELGCLCRNVVRDISCFCLSLERAGLHDCWLGSVAGNAGKRSAFQTLLRTHRSRECRLSPNACSMPRTNWRVRNSLSHATGLCCYLLPGDDCLKIILVMTRHCGSAWGGSKYLEDWEYLNIGVEYKAYILLFISDFTLLNCLDTWNYYVDMI